MTKQLGKIITNKKTVLPKLEEYLQTSTWAFTCNPEIQMFEDSNRLQILKDHIVDLLESPYAEYQLYTELSPTGRIHYHGWLYVKDAFKFILYDLSRIQASSNIAIVKINDEDEWYDYCTKQCHIIRRPCIFINLKKDTGKETKSYLSCRQQFQDSFHRK